MWKRHFISPLGFVRRAVVALAAIALVACGGSTDEPPPATPAAPPVTPAAPQAAPARIEIAPDTVLLTAPGARKALVAKVFDAAGNPVTANVEWNSSRPAAVSVDAAGVVTAAGTGGSSQVTARIGTLSSAPMLVVHTTVPVGAVLLTDAQITGDLVETDPDAPPGVGNTYVARLVGVAAPAVGQLIMNTESKPVAGRVTAVESVGGEHRVTLALVPATEMFPSLVLDEAIDLNRAEVEIPPALRDQYDISRDGNTFTFTPKPGKFVLAGVPPDSRATIATARPQSTATPVGTAALPPFTNCVATLLGAGGAAGLPVGLSLPPQFTFALNNRLDVKYSSATGLEHFVIHGEPRFTINGGLKALVAFEGKVTCEVELLVIRIPVGGPLSLIIGGLVPVGVGAELGGKVTVASMGISTNVVGNTAFDVGISCPGGGDCSLVNTFGPVEVKPVPVIDVPSLGDFRLEPSLSLYAFVKASIGNPFVKKLRYDALGVKVGAAARASFAPMSTQIADPVYKSDYKLLTELRAGAGTQLSGLAAMLGLRAISFVDLLISNTLASSPLGTVAADKSAFVHGDTVNFTVKLDATKIEFPPEVGPYNVREIVLVRRTDITTQQEVARVTAASGQTEFNIPVIADNSGRADEFFAFVVTALAPVDFLALELGQAQGATSPSTIIQRSIFLKADTINSILPSRQLFDVGLKGGFIRTSEVNAIYEGTGRLQRARVSSTEDTVDANNTAFAFEADCNGDILTNSVRSSVEFRIERQTVADISGALSSTDSSPEGGINLRDLSRGGLVFGRVINRSRPSITVSESLTLEPGDYELELSASLACWSFDGISYRDPKANSLQGRMGLRVAP